jgi:general stress protein YciG
VSLTNGNDDFNEGELSPIQKQLSKIGKIGGEATKAKYGVEHFFQIGAGGGRNTARTHSKEWYAEIGRKGGLAKAAKKGVKDVSDGGQDKGKETVPKDRNRQSFTGFCIPQRIRNTTND